MVILLLEPDRVIAKCISKQIEGKGIKVNSVPTADKAIESVDRAKPDLIISELSLRGHSGTEFFYEFRSYQDSNDIPIIIYSSIKPPQEILSSKDWELLNIADFLYKPEVSISELVLKVKDKMEQ